MRKSTYFVLLGLLMISSLFGQQKSDVTRIPLSKVLKPKEQPYDEWSVIVKNKPVENYFGEVTTEKIDSKSSSKKVRSFKTPSNSSLKLELGVNFRGLPGVTPPSDNATSISRDGKTIVHLVNSSIRMIDVDGNVLLENTLAKFFDQSGQSIIDPRVLYDYYEDRYIAVAVTPDHEILLAFSKTNDPTGEWNLFVHTPGGLMDFPIIAITEHELFVSVLNLGSDLTKLDQQVHQISKKEGYEGGTLRVKQYILEGAASIISTTPVSAFKDSEYGNSAFFVAISKTGGNTITLFEITDTLGGSPTVEKQDIELSKEYTMKGMVNIKGTDAEVKVPTERTHKALYNNGIVHVVFCAEFEKTGFNSLCYTQIDLKDKKATSYFYNLPNTDLVNPSLDLLPIDSEMNKSGYRTAICYNQGSKDMFASLVAIICDENGNWTEPLVAKEGEGSLGQAGRVGDYTSCVTNFQTNPSFWVSGEFGNASGSRDNWIAEIKISELVGKEEAVKNQPIKVKLGPNPVREMVMISFSLDKNTKGKFVLYNTEGKIIKHLHEGVLKAGMNQLYFNIEGLTKGSYIVKMENADGGMIVEKIIKK